MPQTTAPRPLRIPSLRRRVEAAGWRTWLTFRENHVRDEHGRLTRVQSVWVAEAEHPDGSVVTCESSSPAQAWFGLSRVVHRNRQAGVAPAAAEYGSQRPASKSYNLHALVARR